MKPLHVQAPRFLCALAAFLLLCVCFSPAIAEETSKAVAATPEQEAKLTRTLTNATLKGRWCSVKDGQLGAEKDDSYEIVSIAKGEGDHWQINARLVYGGKQVDLPIPAVVKWAGDTPVLIFDKVTMGTGRAYSARLMIYENTYSGWWTAPDHGGLLNGVISNK